MKHTCIKKTKETKGQKENPSNHGTLLTIDWPPIRSRTSSVLNQCEIILKKMEQREAKEDLLNDLQEAWPWTIPEDY